MTAELNYLRRDSFTERSARSRAFALLDDAGAIELLGPFDQLESPWLEAQGVVPQSDDGVVVVRGTVAGHSAVVIGIEQAFQGGGIGEVSGAKITAALSMAARDSRAGNPTAAVLLLETGGVRLQEANLGLATIAEACAAALELRPVAPVVGVIAGALGSFGGMSIVAGLCSTIIMTREARLGLNGPEVIESEAGILEIDSTDHALVWSIDGGTQRHALRQADALVHNETAELRQAVANAIIAGPRLAPASRDLRILRAHLTAIDPSAPPAPGELPHIFAAEVSTVSAGSTHGEPPIREITDAKATLSGRGRAWTRALGSAEPTDYGSTLLEATLELGDERGDEHGIVLSVVPDPDSPYRRARHGEVGLLESLVLAERITRIVSDDCELPSQAKRPIVAIVDLPSQAYGRLEEMVGIHLHLAAAVDAYATAREAGHPVVALVVGTALSGGFLAHGLQANQILALDDPAVEIHAMHKAAAARITRRSVAELDQLALTIPPLSYNVRDWATLGLCDGLLTVTDADEPTSDDVASVRDQLRAAILRARREERSLAHRWSVEMSGKNRAATRRVWQAMADQWT